MYGIDLHNNKDRYFTIEDNKRQKFAFLPFKKQITVNKVSPVILELEKFKSEQLKEAEISLHLTDKQENERSSLLYDHKGAFASDKEPLGAIRHNHGNSPPWISVWNIKPQSFYGQLAISITNGQYGHIIILWTICLLGPSWLFTSIQKP
ncbi:hypothetical protein O181_121806 [Austropuccinia psidii MF-1]|uniref:Uncharacterized protein n=1 Tax=Austropuccinia psidii MF-1 TaxID=1389203 RepID=A0A9Q3KKB3_9BASI|nr:hypothetical protein [Austropuccinia psidii MF-1]